MESEEYIDIIDDANDLVELNIQNKENNKNWNILIVDDEEIVHESTKLALQNEKIFNKGCHLFHAYSADEAIEIINKNKNIAVALVDVVMETEYAGLKLVQKLRESGFYELRIILRTGQPGYAPELSVIMNYDINDYKTKNELTRSRLVSILATALRGYQQINVINVAKKSLELIVKATGELLNNHTIKILSEEVLKQFSFILGKKINGFISLLLENQREYEIIAGVGKYKNYENKKLQDLPEENIFFKDLENYDKIVQVADTSDSFLLHIITYEEMHALVYIDCGFKLSNEDKSILRIFGINITTCFKTISLIERLDKMAYTDIETDIPNMNAITRSIDYALERKTELAVIFIHFNSLGRLLSLFGLKVQQTIFVETYKKLKRHFPNAIEIARADWGDFVIVMKRKNYTQSDFLPFLSFVLDTEGISITTTIAAGFSDKKDASSDDLIQRVKLTLSMAKDKTKNRITEFNTNFTDEWKATIIMQHEIRKSLFKKINPLELFLQLKIDSVSNYVVGGEALSRWKMNDAYISPVEFIPVIEDSGYSSILLNSIIEKLADWQNNRVSEGVRIFPVSVNLSMKDILAQDFSYNMLKLLSKNRLSPEMIEFEVTEGLTMTNPDKTIFELTVLKEAGFKIALDDFGTGYSSLSYIGKLPIDILKIDRSFVSNLSVENVRNSMALIIATMADNLDLDLVAEGVETLEQIHALQILGCRICQGFYWGQPMDIFKVDEKVIAEIISQ